MPQQPWRLQSRRFSYDLTGLPMPLLLLRSRRTRQRVSSVLLIGHVIALCLLPIVNRVMIRRRQTKPVPTEVYSKSGTSTLLSRCYSMTPYSILKSRMNSISEADGIPGGDVIRSE